MKHPTGHGNIQPKQGLSLRPDFARLHFPMRHSGGIVTLVWNTSGKDSIEEAEGAGISVQGEHIRPCGEPTWPLAWFKGYCMGLPAGKQVGDLKPVSSTLRR